MDSNLSNVQYTLRFGLRLDVSSERYKLEVRSFVDVMTKTRYGITAIRQAGFVMSNSEFVSVICRKSTFEKFSIPRYTPLLIYYVATLIKIY